MTIYTRIAIASVMLIVTGIGLMAPFAVSHAEQARAVQLVAPIVHPAPIVKAVAKGKPRHITIASVGISLPVADGHYDASTGQWTLSDDKAFYGTPTSPANSESGNTFVYGHNSRNIFGSLPQMKPGDKAVITTDTGYEFTYTFESSENVKPTDTIVLGYDGDTPRLTLQTCSGMWYETRHIFYFKLTSYKKP